MENKRDEACKNVVRYVGIKWGHLGRNKLKFNPETEKEKIRLDCAGLLIENAIDIGLYNEGDDLVHLNYPRIPDGSSLVAHINNICDHKTKDKLQKADVMVMTFNGNPTHLAMYLGDYLNDGGEYFIHASLPDRKVLIQRYDDFWKEVTTDVFSFKGIDN